MTSYTIKPNELEAVALAASNYGRLHLCGVLFEQYSYGRTALIATDGHRLMSVHAQQNSVRDSSFTLANADVKKVLTIVKADKALNQVAADKRRIVATMSGNCELTLSVVWFDVDGVSKTVGSFTTQAMDGNFPDWRRVIPAPVTRTESVPFRITFNSAYIADFAKAAKLLSDKGKTASISITATSVDGPVLIEIPEVDEKKPCEFMGVLMPKRS